MAAPARLQAQFDAIGARSTIYETQATPNCSCTSVVATVHANHGDGSEALLLSVEVGDEADLEDAHSSRACRVAHRLADYLRSARWLAKDVVMLLHPRCACACRSAPEMPACPQGPVRRFLEDYHLLPAMRIAKVGDDDAATAAAIHTGLRARTSGELRQVVTLSLRGDEPPRALAVDLGGSNGRLPNLDLYSTVWKIAGHEAVRVPLVIPATGAEDAWAAVRFALSLAWGAPRGEHAAALTLGLDALSLSGTSQFPSLPVPSGGRPTATLSDVQILRLLEGTLRSLSNLAEALHHSHYTFLLAGAGAIVPFKITAPMLHLPPLLSLGLRALSHQATTVMAVTATMLLHACGLCLALIPPISPYSSSSSMSPAWYLSVVQIVWAVLVWGLAWASQRCPHHLTHDALAFAACISAAALAFGFTCRSLHLGLVGSVALAGIAAAGIPGLVRHPRKWNEAQRRSTSGWASTRRLVGHIFALIALSPCVLLALLVAATTGGNVSLLVVTAEAWKIAAIHNTLPIAFACICCLPLSAVAASIRLGILSNTLCTIFRSGAP